RRASFRLRSAVCAWCVPAAAQQTIPGLKGGQPLIKIRSESALGSPPRAADHTLERGSIGCWGTREPQAASEGAVHLRGAAVMRRPAECRLCGALTQNCHLTAPESSYN